MSEAISVTGRLQGKVVIVSGGGSGIGEGIAKLFARAGATVVIADLPASPGAAVAANIVTAGGRASFIPTDVTKPAETDALVAEVVKKLGALNVVVNTAGILAFGTAADTDVETWRRVIDVNLGGTFNVCHSALAEMIKRGGGSIVNMSSSTGTYDVGANIAAYVASKGGVVMLTKSIAVDHAKDGVRANAISPGPCDTPMLRKILSDEELRKFGSGMPVGRVAQPEELAFAALFLASDEASYVTGAVLAVDGGQTAQIGPILGN